jgi:hypothetical protein
MAKRTPVEVEELEVEDLVDGDEDEDSDEEDESTVTTPKMLAKELGIDPKALRGYLRKAFPRSAKAHNTSWHLTESQIEGARARFSSDEDEEDEGNED